MLISISDGKLTKVTRVPERCFQAPVTLSERQRERNQKVARVVVAALEPSGFSPGVSEM
jgi:hypothetical protein